MFILLVSSVSYMTVSLHLEVTGCKYFVATNLYVRMSYCGAPHFYLVICDLQLASAYIKTRLILRLQTAGEIDFGFLGEYFLDTILCKLL